MAGPKKTVPAYSIEESYPLSPLQQGMVFEGLTARHSGVDIVQVIGTLPEEVNVNAFRATWKDVVERHAILRTGFGGDGLHARQEVHRNVRLHFEQKDWPGLREREQRSRLESFLQADRRRGFELSVPPLMRLALFNVGPANHIFALTYYHLLLDSCALVTLLTEFFNLYEARCHCRRLELPPPRPYRDYIEWLRNRDWSAAEMYWRRQLSGFVTPTPLVVSSSAGKAPADNPRCALQQTVLSSAESERLRSVALENGLSVQTILEGAWAVLLSRYSSEEDVVFGVQRAGRQGTVAGAESIVGLFANTLPLRVRVRPELRAIDWLEELHAQSLALRPHEHTPPVEIQRWSEVPPGEPLFQSLFNFQELSWDAALRAQGGRWAKREFVMRNQPNVPLWADICGGPEMTLKIGYDPGRLEGATIARMLGHYRSLLKGIIAEPAQALAELPLLTDAERQQLLVDWNTTRTEYPRHSNVPELFEAQVARTPNAVALVYGKEEVSYRELDNQANQVLHHLRSLLVGPDVPVGICMHRSAAMVAALLGILKAGGAFVPLDPALPREWLLSMLKHSGATVLLTQESLRRRFKFQIPQGRVVCLEAITGETKRTSLPLPSISSENLACIAYTAGSTGTPKGVELTHRGLVNLLAWHQRAYQVTPSDRASQWAGFSSDASAWELWPYLTAGASIHIVAKEKRASVPDLPRWFKAARITIGSVPTLVAEQILALPWPDHVRLRAILTGGDRLHRRPDPNLPFSLVNLYGSAENSGVATFFCVPPAQNGTHEAPPIGRPIANVQVYVLDRLLRPVPVGVPGELYIGGDGLARGYRNNPARTAEKFLPHPFSDAPGARLYRTGDLVRWQADGNLQFIGRVDERVKLRGYWIEPGEMETQLNRHPGVRESLVLASPVGQGRKQLVAYFIPRRSPAPANKELSDFLRTMLPDQMVPSAFISLDAWPLTPNGKVDRRALPQPEPPARPSRRSFTGPRNQIEETVTRIWAELLGRQRVGVRDNLFELGGNSLLAKEAVARLEESFNIKLSIRILFKKPIAADLAREIERRVAKHAPQREPGIERVVRDPYRVNGLSCEAGAELLKHR